MVETVGVSAFPGPTASAVATVVIPRVVGEAVAAAVGDPTKVLVLPVAGAKVGSLGELLVVAGAVVAAVVEFGTRVVAWGVGETRRTVGVGGAFVVADKRGTLSCLVVVEAFVCPAPSLGRVAVVLAAMGLLLVGAGCVDVAGEASLDT